MSARDRPRAVAVVVPVHNEADLLGACLASVTRAADVARRSGTAVRVWVVLDACTDSSAEIARDADVEVIGIDARCVGAARDAGVAAALRAAGPTSPHRLWLAHTDADSTVPSHWITHQVREATRGADVVIGTVRPDENDLTPAQIDAWWRTHVPGEANGHVHGANLGIRASTYLRAGGFGPLPLHEDVALVESARGSGARLAATDDAWVRTSGRSAGRAPDGYARYLREDLAPCSAVVDAGRAGQPGDESSQIGVDHQRTADVAQAIDEPIEAAPPHRGHLQVVGPEARELSRTDAHDIPPRPAEERILPSVARFTRADVFETEPPRAVVLDRDAKLGQQDVRPHLEMPVKGP